MPGVRLQATRPVFSFLYVMYFDPNLENQFTSVIREIIYHGDHTRVRVNLLGNDEFILKVPNASSDLDFNVGDNLDLGWSSHDCRALDY